MSIECWVVSPILEFLFCKYVLYIYRLKHRYNKQVHQTIFVHYIKCKILSKSWKWELGFVRYIKKFTISRFVISRFECTYYNTLLTSSTHAQKWSSALGWMSPHVITFKKFSLGKGFISRLIKYTPLFFRAAGQSVWATRCPEKFWLITNSWKE